MIVVKLGGRTFEEPAGRARLLGEIADLVRTDHVLVVHGGGNRVTAELAASGVPATFVRGLRVTDEATLGVVERVLTLVGKGIAHDLTEAGAPAIALTGRDASWLRADVRPDLGRVGKVRRADATTLERLVGARFTPVLAPLAVGPDGGLLNVNADEVAGAVAAAVRAKALLLLTDVDAVLGPDGPVAALDAAGASKLLDAGLAKDGMAPKLDAALVASRVGCAVAIANGNREGVLRDALAGRTGTRVVA